VFVDCDWGNKNSDLSTKFAVRGYPTVAFCDPEGKQVAMLGSRDPASVATQIEEVAKKYGSSSFESFDKAAAKAKEDKKPVLYLFTKPNMASSIALALEDASMKELLEKFTVARSEIGKANADAKALSVTESSLFVLDPNSEASKPKVIVKLTGKKDAKEVRKALEDGLKKFEGGAAEK
jgi:hypothetical protein